MYNTSFQDIGIDVLINDVKEKTNKVIENLKRKKVVVLTGAGISKESGLDTFRDSDGTGIWGKYKLEDVCTSSAWSKNPQQVNDFYNVRRNEVLNNKPNKAHFDLVELEKHFDVTVITTNVDNYHELAGSSDVIHLHGEILKARSSHPKYDWMGLSFDDEVNNPKLYPVGREGLNIHRDFAEDNMPLRPFIVFFGESVPNIDLADCLAQVADYFIVVGTSLSVTPASSLVSRTSSNCKTYCIDPNLTLDENNKSEIINISKVATEGVQEAVKLIIKDSKENKNV